jgi:hypothetical protein
LWSLFENNIKCEKLVKYDTRMIEFKGLEAEVTGTKISFAGFKTEIERVRQVAELAATLDDYQYLVCKEIKEYDKASEEYRKYKQLRMGMILLITKVRVILAAFKDDPSGQKENLAKLVTQIVNFENLAIDKGAPEVQWMRLPQKRVASRQLNSVKTKNTPTSTKTQKLKIRMNKIEEAVNSLSPKILSYSCNLGFDFAENNDSEQAAKHAMQETEKWVQNALKFAKAEITTESIPGQGDAYVFRLAEGTVKITKPRLSRSFAKEGYSQTGNIFMTTDSYDAFDKIITNGGHSYWHIEWLITEKMDINSLIDKVNEQTGKKPSSKSGTGYGNTVKWSSADYTLLYDENMRIRMTIAGGEERVMIGVTHDDASFDKGFFTAHKRLTPELVMSILFGEIKIPEIRKIFKESLK